MLSEARGVYDVQKLFVLSAAFWVKLLDCACTGTFLAILNIFPNSTKYFLDLTSPRLRVNRTRRAFKPKLKTSHYKPSKPLPLSRQPDFPMNNLSAFRPSEAFESAAVFYKGSS